MRSKLSARGGPIQSGRKVSGKGRESGHKGHDQHAALGTITSGRAGKISTSLTSRAKTNALTNKMGPIKSGRQTRNPLMGGFGK